MLSWVQEPTKEITVHNRFSDETFTQSCQVAKRLQLQYMILSLVQNEPRIGHCLMRKGRELVSKELYSMSIILC